ncbi:hypothetical protein BJ138DRAFT_1120627 [Hygrophoropsis aurantiaca]|uniref:Uncharacterized protein n=1 Tax=Hygrophoropsis aurantiaca TaxID=72124 RepID=A0ACB7ZPQ8_9AGAM|nr:hypothetical protein BJ138DRAFT_1120627 [Hygrophoropsis aurantiaca]
MPSLFDIYGAMEDPWDLDVEDSDFFISALQDIVDRACPQEQYTVVKGDVVYRIARQQMYEWHRGFIKSAGKAIKTSIAERFGANPPVSTIKSFVAQAIAPGGEAFSGPVKNKSTLQPFRSPFVLKTIAYHLVAMQGTLFEDHQYPIGALALSLVSVQMAFNMYASGKLVPNNGFTNENAGSLTREYTRGDDFA